MPRRLIASLAGIAAALTIAACGSSGTASPAGTPASSSNAVANRAAHVPAQLQFTTKTIDGKPFSGESLAGKATVLWFWTPWCPKCQQEAPIVARAAAANPEATFVGVAAREEASAMQAFVDKYQLGDVTQLADSDGQVWSNFGVTQQPAWAFISANGEVEVVKGGLSEAQLTERVNGLTGK